MIHNERDTALHGRAGTLAARDISKSFPGVQALKDVSLECRAGQVLGVIGENGAGKSTLMNVLTGVIQPDGGKIFVDGRECRFSVPQDARREGIRIVYQELSLLPHLTVMENITLNREPVGALGFIDVRGAAREAERLLKRIAPGVAVDLMAGLLSPAEQQLVEIAKALGGNPRVLILDEPTASLSRVETGALLDVIRDLRAQGIAVIFISHRLEEIIELCDRVVVLKDGGLVGTVEKESLARDRLVSMMVGREWSQVFPPRSKPSTDAPVLQLRDVGIRGEFQGVSLAVYPGEILGIGGLEGQGQRGLIRAIFGIEQIEQGDLLFQGARRVFRSPREAIRAGVAFISDDRKTEGVILNQTVASNMVLTVLRKISAGFFIRRSRERQIIRQRIEELSIKVSSPEQRARELSGGNQQKVIIARWLETAPKLLILHEPTRGIDVQTKMQIYQLLRDLAARGMAVLIVTSDMLELIGLSDRIAVIYEGRIVGELPAAEASEERIMALESGRL
jgi:ribose transport system ATP-binding protein